MKRIKIAAAIAVSALVVGCSSIPAPEDRPTPETVGAGVTSGWGNIPAIEYRSSRQAAELMSPGKLPDSIYEMQIDMELQKAMGINELVYILDSMGVPVMLATNDLADTNIFLPRYKGTVGTILEAISTTNDISFNWINGVLIIEKISPYLLKVPQNKEIGDMISGMITSMGGESVNVSAEAGIISYSASMKNQRVIQAYLDRLTLNTAMVNLQVAVINVSLDEQRRSGFDWSALSLQAGDLGLISDLTDYSEGIAGVLTRSGASLVFNDSNLSLQGALNLLSSYGDSQTVQNLTLKTLSGVAVELNSGQSIPYVENISLNVADGSSTSGTDTATVDTGFDITISPLFDAEDNIVTVELDLSMKSLIGFRELSAGNQIGTLSRPEIQDQSIKNIARLQAGETVLVGGLIYENISDNRSTLGGLESLPIGSKSTIDNKNALFILIRPSVVVFGKQDRQSMNLSVDSE